MPESTTIYLTTLRCGECADETTFAHEGGTVPFDQEAPWPDVKRCPVCAAFYDDDLGVDMTEVAEAARVPPTGEPR